MERIAKWLIANPLAAAVIRRLVVLLLGALLGLLSDAGLFGGELVQALQDVLSGL